MSNYFFYISVILFAIAVYGLWSGKTWYGGKVYYRETARMNYYLGILSYIAIAVFAYLFGREL